MTNLTQDPPNPARAGGGQRKSPSWWAWCLCLLFLALSVGAGCQCGAPGPQEKVTEEKPIGGGDKASEGKGEQGLPDAGDPDTVSPDSLADKDGADAGPVGDSLADGQPDVASDAAEPGAPDSVNGDGPVGEKEPDFQGPRFHFRVTAQTEDTVPPKLLSLGFGSARIKAGEVLLVYVTVGTDLSDVVSAQVNLTGPSPSDSMYVSMAYHPSKKRFEGRVQTSIYTAPGDWKVDRVFLQDGARNPSVYLGTNAPLLGLKFGVDKNTLDSKGPVATAFSLLGSTVKAGGFLMYTLAATDDVSGVEAIEVTVSPKAGGPQIRGEAVYDPARAAYVGVLRIPSTGPDGTWQVERADMRDKASNFSSLSTMDALLKGKEFTVSDAQAPPALDSKPPVLKAAFLAPLVVATGNQIRVLADASDADSGVRSIEAQVSDPGGAVKFQFNLFLNAASGLWEGTGAVPLFSKIGVWRIEQIQVRDVAGNAATVPIAELQMNIPYIDSKRQSDLLAHLSVDVTALAGPKDETGPVIKGFHLSPGEVKAGESVRVFTRLEEPGDSGVASASCTFDGPVPQLRRQVTLSLNSDTGFYEGNLTFRSSDPAGDWWVSGCFLTDRAGNRSPIAGWSLTKLAPLDISRATTNPSKDPFVVKVTNTTTPPTDTVPPTMKAAQLAPGEIKAGESLRFFVSVEDVASGVAEGRCGFKVLEGIGLGFNRVTTVATGLTLNPSTGFWEGTLSLPADAVPGEWVLQRCEWSDSAGNQAVYEGSRLDKVTALALGHTRVTPSTKHLSFKVLSGGPPPADQVAPVLEKLAIAPATAKAGDTVRVFAQVKEQGEIFSSFCSVKPSIFEPPRTSYGAAHLKWNPASQLWEGAYRIPSGARNGVWTLSGCQFEDDSLNAAKPGPSVIRTTPKLDLTAVLGRTLQKNTMLQVTAAGATDKTPPTAKDFKWSATAAKAGESLLLEADAADPGGKVLRVDVVVQSPTSKGQIRNSLAFNPATLRWEGVLRFPTDAEDGKWKIQRVDVSDAAGNITTYVSTNAPLLGKEVDITGTAPSTDLKPPEVKKVTRSKGIVVAGSSFRVAAELTDDVSGVASASAAFTSPSGKYNATAFLSYNANSKLWEGEVLIPKEGEDGVWKPSSLRVQDRAGRSTQVSGTDALFMGVVVTVRGSVANTDTTPPTIQNLQISPAKVSAGEPVQIEVEAKDDSSGIKSVEVQIEAPDKSRLLFVSLNYDPVTKRFIASQTIPVTAAAGQWVVTKVTIVDNAGNRLVVTRSDPFLP